jgi:hypothetical protein
MSHSAVTTQGFVGAFGDVWAAHDDPNASLTQGIGDTVGFGDHASHGSDADEANLLVMAEGDDLFVSHGAGVAVDEQDLVTGGSQRLEEEHPEVRHEIARHPVVRVV